MAEFDADKTHDPTPHRRERARAEGQVPRSQDLSAAAMLVVGLALVQWFGGGALASVSELTRTLLGGEARLHADVDWTVDLAGEVAGVLAAAVLPMFGVLFVAAVAVNVGQTGFLFLPAQAAPDFSRVDPIQGAARIFKPGSLVQLAFGLLKLSVVAAVMWFALSDRVPRILGLTALEGPSLAAALAELVLGTALTAACVLLALATLDYAYQWWKHEQNLRMTPQEVREEMKEMVGDPQVLSRRRQAQQRMAAERLSLSVPKADLVIAGPQFAVALQYDARRMTAPLVLAKGAGPMAERIKALAQQHTVWVVDDPRLAEELATRIAVQRTIPAALFAPVAAILARAYERKGTVRRTA